MAVDSRAAAPHAPGPVPRASLPPHRARHGPLVRRRGATAIGPTTRRRVAVDAPRKGSAVRAVSPISVGATAHVIAGNCGVVRRSEPRNPRADCVLGHGVAMALRYHFFSSFRLRTLGATALRLLEQVQGILDAVRLCAGTASRALLFCAIFLMPPLPRLDASDAVPTQATSNHPKRPLRRLATANEPARSETTAQHQPHRRLPPARHLTKKTTQP